jgi:hypothetical protein
MQGSPLLQQQHARFCPEPIATTRLLSLVSCMPFLSQLPVPFCVSQTAFACTQGSLIDTVSQASFSPSLLHVRQPRFLLSSQPALHPRPPWLNCLGWGSSRPKTHQPAPPMGGCDQREWQLAAAPAKKARIMARTTPCCSKQEAEAIHAGPLCCRTQIFACFGPLSDMEGASGTPIPSNKQCSWERCLRHWRLAGTFQGGT